MTLGNKQKEFLGDYLAARRVTSGLSQKDVAKKFGWGSAQYVSNIERGVCATPSGHLKQLIKLYGMDKKNFIGLMQGLYAETIKKELI